jgi:hypothetical protein
MRHARLAFMPVGGDGAGLVEQGGDTHADSETQREFPWILIHRLSNHAAESHSPFLLFLVYTSSA